MALQKKRSLVAGRTNAERIDDAVKRKAVFLAAYEEWGTIKKACEAAGMSRMSYRNWEKADPEFVKHLDLMKQSFAESLESIALDRVKNPDKNRGSDVLLLGLLNANLPAKFRPSIAVDQDSAKELITEWRKASQAVLASSPKKENQDLPVSVEKTLAEILEKRGNAPREKDGTDEAH
tara:strand:- start:10937 stop:11470 length:534 start_codon:yes stop_codon:yes gene_type:complete